MNRLLSILFLFTSLNVLGQEGVRLETYLKDASVSSSYEFYFKSEWINDISVVDDSRPDLLHKIKEAVAPFGLLVYVHEGTNVFIYPSRVERDRKRLGTGSYENIKQSDMVRIGTLLDTNSNDESVLSGRITDQSDEPLVGVNVIVNDQLTSLTDGNGNYSITLKPGNYIVKFSYIGMETETRLITFYSKGELDVSLFEDSELLDEVVIEATNFNQSSEAVPVGVQKLSIAKLEKLPSFLGDVDVVKSATALPGVTSSGESSSYLNIRGGRNDQTLVLMNNSTIYNPGHMLGFFSVFNGDLVSEMAVYKGNIPARYGNRASSVLDVKTENWASDKVNFYGGLGIANSNLGLKTRLLDDKLDLNVGGRISYVDWLLKLIPDKNIVQSTAQFGDLNLNARYRFNEKNSFGYYGYYGGDLFRFSNRIIYKWNTFNSGVKWTHNLKDDWIIESELFFSDLSNSSEGIEPSDSYLFTNGISEWSAKSVISNSRFEAGIDYTRYKLRLGEVEPTTATSFRSARELEKDKLLTLSTHASYLFRFDNGFEINPGARLNYYANRGSRTIRNYQEGMPTTADNVVGVETFDQGEVISSQQTIEPRLGIAYKNGNSTIRSGYSRINQFLHLISNTTLINPSTVWKGSDQYIPRTVIDQFSLGYEYQMDKPNVTFSVDGFYKNMKDAIDFRDGATLLINDALEQEILAGEGTAYGVELMVSKGPGKLSGFLSYTFSRSFIKVMDEKQGIAINNGERYPYYTDRPHSINASLDYKLTKKFTLSSNFTFTSGAPINAPIGVYQIEGKSIPLYSDRNAARIPDYHRLDIVITKKNRVRKTKKNNDRWVLTFYNVYGRNNVATIFFSSEGDQPGQSFKLINVGRIVPTLTYKFEF